MTSTAGTAQHPEVSEISDLTEGLLPPSRAAEVRGHLAAASCAPTSTPPWRRSAALLGTLPGPLARCPPTSPAGSTRRSPPKRCSTPRRPAGHSVSRETGPHARPRPFHVKQRSRPAAAAAATGRPAGRAARPGPAGSRRARRHAPGRGAGPRIRLGTAVGLQRSFPAPAAVTRTPPADGDSRRERCGGRAADAVGGRPSGSTVHRLERPGATSRSCARRNVDTKSSPETSAPAAPPDAPARHRPSTVPLLRPAGIGRTDDTARLPSRAPTKARPPISSCCPHATDSTRVQAYVVDASCVDSATRRLRASCCSPTPTRAPEGDSRALWHFGNARPVGSVGWGESSETEPQQ